MKQVWDREIMMLKTNHTNGFWLARAGTAGMLILGVLLMGCDKDSKQPNLNASAEQALEPPAITRPLYSAFHFEAGRMKLRMYS